MSMLMSGSDDELRDFLRTLGADLEVQVRIIPGIPACYRPPPQLVPAWISRRGNNPPRAHIRCASLQPVRNHTSLPSEEPQSSDDSGPEGRARGVDRWAAGKGAGPAQPSHPAPAAGHHTC